MSTPVDSESGRPLETLHYTLCRVWTGWVPHTFDPIHGGLKQTEINSPVHMEKSVSFERDFNDRVCSYHLQVSFAFPVADGAGVVRPTWVCMFHEYVLRVWTEVWVAQWLSDTHWRSSVHGRNPDTPYFNWFPKKPREVRGCPQVPPEGVGISWRDSGGWFRRVVH